MARRILAVWLPRLATDRLARRGVAERDGGGHGREGRPLAAVAGVRGRRLLTAVDALAEQAGLAPGMTLADARAVEPGLVAVEADPAADARALDGLADWCGRYTPWVGTDPPDGLVLDVTGCAHLLGGEPALLDDVARRLRAFGYACRLALADTPAAAAALARFHPRDAVRAPSGRGREALAPLPVAALRLDATTTALLGRLGLRRIGDLYPLPRPSLAVRLGAAVVRRLDQALGLAAEPVSPRRPVPPHAARMAFAEPISERASMDAALTGLLARLCAGLERAGQGARLLELCFFRMDGRVERARIGTARPVRDPGHLARLFAEKLERLDPGPGFEAASLLAEAEPLVPSQGGLAAPGLADPGMPPALAELVDRLGNRLGPDGVQRLLPRESWWPERAVEPAPALARPTAAAPWPVDRPRPVRLLAVPEPILATALVPDDPPVMFRWREALHRVSRADGPERIEPEWWRALTEPRDYYRVEDEAGCRFWLFRTGFDRTARWFLHGVFP
ncbi:Y-family DNA polymerase [Arenibaculum pallidiluteum]|uniref:Y-family DNA polymerase n=1 Tax=Arenibaculum pallidiluteum TaxID=2812559 RepID=UPI001A9656C1|nr:DNA polymerase Y family protein [Arenibaculum pallidiluteum]